MIPIKLTERELKIIVTPFVAPWVGLAWMIAAAVCEWWSTFRPGLFARLVELGFNPVLFLAGLWVFVHGRRRQLARAHLIARLRSEPRAGGDCGAKQ